MHDSGAVQYSMLYAIPGYGKIFGNQENMLVNNKSRVADNRAGDYIIIDP